MCCWPCHPNQCMAFTALTQYVHALHFPFSSFLIPSLPILSLLFCLHELFCHASSFLLFSTQVFDSLFHFPLSFLPPFPSISLCNFIASVARAIIQVFCFFVHCPLPVPFTAMRHILSKVPVGSFQHWTFSTKNSSQHSILKHLVNDGALFVPEVSYKPSTNKCLASHLIRKNEWGSQDANVRPSMSWICSVGRVSPLRIPHLASVSRPSE